MDETAMSHTGVRKASKADDWCSRHCALGFLIHGFWAGGKVSLCGVWTAPAAGKTLPTSGALRGPPFGRVFPAAGAAQTPTAEDVRSVQKPCIQNPSARRVQSIKTMASVLRYVTQ